MKKITGLDSLLCGLDGVAIVDEGKRPVVIGRVIANVLAGSASKEPARAMSIAMQLYACPETLEMEDADHALVLKAIQDAELPSISKAPALAVLEGTEPD